MSAADATPQPARPGQPGVCSKNVTAMAGANLPHSDPSAAPLASSRSETARFELICPHCRSPFQVAGDAPAGSFCPTCAALVGRNWPIMFQGPSVVGEAPLASAPPDDDVAYLSAFADASHGAEVSLDDRVRLRAIAASLQSERVALETAQRVHLRRHTRLAEALGMDPGYSVDATINKAIEVIRAAPHPETRNG